MSQMFTFPYWKNPQLIITDLSRRAPTCIKDNNTGKRIEFNLTLIAAYENGGPSRKQHKIAFSNYLKE